MKPTTPGKSTTKKSTPRKPTKQQRENELNDALNGLSNYHYDMLQLDAVPHEVQRLIDNLVTKQTSHPSLDWHELLPITHELLRISRDAAEALGDIVQRTWGVSTRKAATKELDNNVLFRHWDEARTCHHHFVLAWSHAHKVGEFYERLQPQERAEANAKRRPFEEASHSYWLAREDHEARNAAPGPAVCHGDDTIAGTTARAEGEYSPEALEVVDTTVEAGNTQETESGGTETLNEDREGFDWVGKYKSWGDSDD